MRILATMLLIPVLLAGCGEDNIVEPEPAECIEYNVDFIATGTGQELYDMFFLTPDLGWAVGDNGIVIKSIDGGMHWQVQDSGRASRLYSVQFLNSDTGWAVGTDGSLLQSEDGGQTWTARTISDRHLTDLFIYDRLRTWIVGDSVILNTQDGGNIFLSYPPQVSELPILYRVDFSDLLNGWTVGTGGSILHTDNGGTSWLRQPTGTVNPLFGIDMLNDRIGWAVGIGGTVFHTNNSGSSWIDQPTPVNTILRGVAFADSLNGLAVGDVGTVVATNNGGEIFEEIVLGTSNHLHQVVYLNDSTALACGENGMLTKIIRISTTCEE